MHFILCSLAVAKARAKAREQMTKRHTPPAIIAERYNLVDTYLQTYAAKVDSLYVYDSTENKFFPKPQLPEGNFGQRRLNFSCFCFFFVYFRIDPQAGLCYLKYVLNVLLRLS